MKFNRRAAIAALAATAAFATPQTVMAQSDDPITFVVPYGAGGLIDGIVRQVADMMTKDLGQPVLVENKPGANGIDYANKTGKPLRYATLGPGSVTHLFGLTMAKELGVEMADVAYRNNSSALVDLIGGQAELNFSSPISLLEHQKSGDLKILALTTPERMEQFPDIPTTTELGYPNLVSSFWFGLMAPAGTPQEMIDRVSAATEKAMSDPDLQAQMLKVGMIPEPGGPADLQKQLDSDMTFWGAVVKDNEIVLQ